MHHSFHFGRLISSSLLKTSHFHRHPSMASLPHVHVPQQPVDKGGEQTFVSVVLRRVSARSRGRR
ncbi:hypothetical protein F2Q69_00014563 [Brassica cretica]|uniref:Uncharacterized protein n=2 Tax=Brassica cretica TaxID=69181 RepID=A0A8S9QQH0_BRACR|nr:hypothetical protein F2Q69_00014563 [Brassica cretica]KAF3583169.1 hypothetical protein DY000_02032156 [Brassica cretica]